MMLARGTVQKYQYAIFNFHSQNGELLYRLLARVGGDYVWRVP